MKSQKWKGVEVSHDEKGEDGPEGGEATATCGAETEVLVRSVNLFSCNYLSAVTKVMFEAIKLARTMQLSG